jgi:hypothetical protein
MSEGVIAIVATIVGAFLAFFGDSWRENRTKKRRATYLAIRTAIALDSFVESCASALSNNDDAYNQRVYEDPSISFDMPEKFQIPDDVDWTSVDLDIAYKILEIPKRDKEARAFIEFVLDVGGDGRDARDERFLGIALDAAALAKELRCLYPIPAIPPKEGTKDWDPVRVLQKKQRARTLRQERMTAS